MWLVNIRVHMWYLIDPIYHDDKDDVLRYVASVWPHRSYPFLYGSLPQTWENSNIKHNFTGYPGDDDPMDVVDISAIESVQEKFKWRTDQLTSWLQVPDTLARSERSKSWVGYLWLMYKLSSHLRFEAWTYRSRRTKLRTGRSLASTLMILYQQRSIVRRYFNYRQVPEINCI